MNLSTNGQGIGRRDHRKCHHCPCLSQRGILTCPCPCPCQWGSPSCPPGCSSLEPHELEPLPVWPQQGSYSLQLQWCRPLQAFSHLQSLLVSPHSLLLLHEVGHHHQSCSRPRRRHSPMPKRETSRYPSRLLRFPKWCHQLTSHPPIDPMMDPRRTKQFSSPGVLQHHHRHQLRQQKETSVHCGSAGSGCCSW